MDGIGRRDLLKGAAALGAVAATGSLGACAGSTTSAPTATTGRAASAGVLDRLASLVDGAVVRPDDPRYDAVRLLYNPRFDGIRPSAVVEAASAKDVATVVTFARENGLPLRVRNGGHSMAGYSTGEGLVLDVRRLTDMSLAADGETATLGSGFTTLNAYRALWPKTKKVVALGLCPTVGITGVTTGGGLGVFDRSHGVASDQLVAVELVLADGSIVRADERERADLFWAIRGGGGGTFGVVTSLTYRLVPADMPFTSTTYTFPWSAAAALVTSWQQWLATAPRTTWSMVQLVTQDPRTSSSPTAIFEVVHRGGGDEVGPIVADLLSAIGTPPASTDSETTEFLTDETNFYCKGLAADECELVDIGLAGKIPRPSMYMASDVQKQPWSADGVALLVEGMERRQRDRVLTPDGFDAGHHVGKMFFEPMDGAVHELAPDATAFVHRDAICNLQYQARWAGGAPQDVADANIDWLYGVYEATKAHRSGRSYVNYIDPKLENWEQAYWGANLPRLRAVKETRDPDNVFSSPQSIRPA